MIKKVEQYIRPYFKIIRYLLGGSVGAVTLLSLLFLFNSILDVHYLTASVAAYLIAFVVSFLMQKFFTFEDKATKMIERQFGIFVFIGVINLGANTLFMYSLVDLAGLLPLVAQFFTSAVIAIWSFFLYQRFIFKNIY